jgi:hypothetical protein
MKSYHSHSVIMRGVPNVGTTGNRNLSMKLSERVSPANRSAGALFSSLGVSSFFYFDVIQKLN